MDRKAWGVIIVIFSLVLIAGIVYVIFFYKFSAPETPVAEQPAVEQTQAPSLPATPAPVVEEPAAAAPAPVAPIRKAEVDGEDLARMSSAFAERFGSFSNQSDYGNIRDLRIFMTEQMASWADNYIEEARARNTNTAVYYGIITKAVSSEIKQFDADAGAAEILVKTQRRESAGITGNSLTFYQDIIIKYRRESGVWRVDGIYWQSR